MKVVVSNIDTGLVYDKPSVEITCTTSELDTIVDVLEHLQKGIKKYSEEKEGKKGFTHLHLQDIDETVTGEDFDIVLYVDLDS